MMMLIQQFVRPLKNVKGATAIEYALSDCRHDRCWRGCHWHIYYRGSLPVVAASHSARYPCPLPQWRALR
jgi:hypothetical protein